MNLLLYRCGGCRNFLFLSLVHFAKCPLCSFMAIRCEKCGGVKGAGRSVKSHLAWYKGVGVKKYKYQDLHNVESDDYQRLLKMSATSKPLAVVKSASSSKLTTIQKAKARRRS